MKRTGVAILGLAVVAFALPAFAGGEKEGKCICGSVEPTTVAWCDHCGVGLAFGEHFKSKKLFKALAGHEVDKDEIKCPACKTAFEKDGTCTHCGVSFADGRAYHSPVSRALLAGMYYPADKVKCEGCKKAVKEGKGYCDHCKVGVVAGLFFKDKNAYKEAEEARDILAKATESKCEMCAVAIVTDGTCEHCKVSFKDGKKTEG